jgi:hypothetical protein
VPCPSPPEDFVLYLDENLCNSKAIQDTLTGLSIRFERQLAHFPRGTPDETWLPLVGSNSWVLLTSDKRIRYNFLEKRALEEHAVRELVFTSGNMSGQDMAAALKLALPKMRRLSRKLKPPFVVAITRTGEVYVRWPKE